VRSVGGGGGRAAGAAAGRWGRRAWGAVGEVAGVRRASLQGAQWLACSEV